MWYGMIELWRLQWIISIWILWVVGTVQQQLEEGQGQEGPEFKRLCPSCRRVMFERGYILLWVRKRRVFNLWKPR